MDVSLYQDEGVREGRRGGDVEVREGEGAGRAAEGEGLAGAAVVRVVEGLFALKGLLEGFDDGEVDGGGAEDEPGMGGVVGEEGPGGLDDVGGLVDVGFQGRE